MNQITYNQDGTINAVYGTSDGVNHHFHFPVSAASYSKRLDSSIDTSSLSTGSIPCTDLDCSTSICTTFPLTGDGIAQQAHCMYRYAISKSKITLQKAAQSVIDDVVAAGGTPRIDMNGQVI